MKKIWFGGAVTAFVFCGLIAANSLLFPSVLAMTGTTSEVQSVNVEELDALVASESGGESDTKNVNMISEEKAVELAIKHLKQSEIIKINEIVTEEEIDALPYKTRLVEAAAPLNKAIWSIAFYREEENRTVILSVTVDAMGGNLRTPLVILKRPNEAELSSEEKESLKLYSFYGFSGDPSLGIVAKDLINSEMLSPEVYDKDGLFVGFFDISLLSENQVGFPFAQTKDRDDLAETWLVSAFITSDSNNSGHFIVFFGNFETESEVK